MIQELSLRVVGVAHPNANGTDRRAGIMACTPGEFIELRLEPENLADSNAVAVFNALGAQIGYLSAERAPWIGSIMRDGRDVIAIFQSPAPYGAVIRAAFDGLVPTLPAEKLALEPENRRPAMPHDEWDAVDWIPPDDE